MSSKKQCGIIRDVAAKNSSQNGDSRCSSSSLTCPLAGDEDGWPSSFWRMPESRMMRHWSASGISMRGFSSVSFWAFAAALLSFLLVAMVAGTWLLPPAAQVVSIEVTAG